MRIFYRRKNQAVRTFLTLVVIGVLTIGGFYLFNSNTIAWIDAKTAELDAMQSEPVEGDFIKTLTDNLAEKMRRVQETEATVQRAKNVLFDASELDKIAGDDLDAAIEALNVYNGTE